MPAALTDNDTDWEYEYDEAETEDFYITLDLTTHVPPVFAYDKASKTNKTLRGSNKSLANAIGTTPAQSSIQLDNDSATSLPHASASDQMQLIDLQSKNPLLSYNNTLYSCQWATDVGTSLYLTQPAADSDPNHPPLRSLPTLDLLATSRARLVATPATILPRTSPLPAVSALGPVAHHESFTTQEGDKIHHTDGQGFRIDLPTTASASKVAQARFLERLSAIKAKKGDQDAVPITNIKIYRHPEGWEQERDEWIAKETALSAKDRLEAEMRMTNRRLLSTVPGDDDQSVVGTNDTPIRGDVDDQSDNQTGTPDPDAIDLSGQLPKRKGRGGPRGGAPSGKRLRQSLGLPEARRDKRVTGRPNGRPRKIQLDSDLARGQEATASSNVESPVDVRQDVEEETQAIDGAEDI